jgi:hypothetical protein
MDVNAPAAPRTPRRARRIAERRWEEVGVGNSVGDDVAAEVVLVGDVIVAEVVGEEEEKNEVGRAIIITPRREIKDAY